MWVGVLSRPHYLYIGPIIFRTSILSLRTGPLPQTSRVFSTRCTDSRRCIVASIISEVISSVHSVYNVYDVEAHCRIVITPTINLYFHLKRHGLTANCTTPMVDHTPVTTIVRHGSVTTADQSKSQRDDGGGGENNYCLLEIAVYKFSRESAPCWTHIFVPNIYRKFITTSSYTRR